MRYKIILLVHDTARTPTIELPPQDFYNHADVQNAINNLIVLKLSELNDNYVRFNNQIIESDTGNIAYDYIIREIGE